MIIFMPNRGYCLYIYILSCDALGPITCKERYFNDDKDNYVRMVWSQSNKKLDWSFKFNMLVFFHKTNFNNELVSCTCITLLKLNKLKRDQEINS